MTNPIFVFEELAFPYPRVIEALKQSTRTLGISGGNTPASDTDALPIEIRLGSSDISHGSGTVIRLLQKVEIAAEDEGGPAASFQLEWAAESTSEFSPVMRASLVISPLTRTETKVGFRGEYAPPLNIQAEIPDGPIVKSTVRRFLRSVTEGIERRINTLPTPDGEFATRHQADVLYQERISQQPRRAKPLHGKSEAPRPGGVSAMDFAAGIIEEARKTRGLSEHNDSPFPHSFHGFPESILPTPRIDSGVRLTASQLRALNARVEQAREGEATRISREIHDQLGSALISIKWELEWLHPRLARVDDLLSEEPLAGRVQRMIELLGETVQSVQRISREIRPSTLDKLNLIESIEGEAREFEQRTGIRCSVVNHGEPRLGRKKATAAFRILHECLTNVMRHSNASRVNITTITCEFGFELVVQDDGVGFGGIDFSDPACLGLLGITERIQSVGGSVEFLDGEAGGALVRIKMRTDERSAEYDPDSAD